MLFSPARARSIVLVPRRLVAAAYSYPEAQPILAPHE